MSRARARIARRSPQVVLLRNTKSWFCESIHARACRRRLIAHVASHSKASLSGARACNELAWVSELARSHARTRAKLDKSLTAHSLARCLHASASIVSIATVAEATISWLELLLLLLLQQQATRAQQTRAKFVIVSSAHTHTRMRLASGPNLRSRYICLIYMKRFDKNASCLRGANRLRGKGARVTAGSARASLWIYQRARGRLGARDRTDLRANMCR